MPERPFTNKEAIMKKVILVTIAVVLLSAVPGLAAGNNQYGSALKAYYRGHYKEAVKELQDYVKREPDAAAYYLIGYGLYKLGMYKEATEYFDQAYLINPTFSPDEIGFGKFAAGKSRKAAGRPGRKKKAECRKK